MLIVLNYSHRAYFPVLGVEILTLKGSRYFSDKDIIPKISQNIVHTNFYKVKKFKFNCSSRKKDIEILESGGVNLTPPALE